MAAGAGEGPRKVRVQKGFMRRVGRGAGSSGGAGWCVGGPGEVRDLKGSLGGCVPGGQGRARPLTPRHSRYCMGLPACGRRPGP